MMNLWLRAGLVVVALLAVSHAWTHQQKEAVTRVLFNQRTGNIEVMHRFLLHDAEHAVKEQRNGEANILDSKDDREFFSDYVNQRFSIHDQDGRALPLEPVGHEIEGRFLWVYAETAIPLGISSLTLYHGALLDIWPEQFNLVNVERNGEVKSATFTGGSTELTIELAGQ
jgi:hypothetical protein